MIDSFKKFATGNVKMQQPVRAGPEAAASVTPQLAVVLLSSVAWMTLAATTTLRAQSELRPGLFGEYRDSQGVVVQRIDSKMGFDWSEGRADLRSVAGPLHVRWRGFLESEGSGDYRLYAFGVGRFHVQLNGQVILSGTTTAPGWIDGDAIHLDYDQHALEITYEAESVPKQIAFFWSGPGFRLEPLSRAALLHNSISGFTDSFERGKHLYQALRCAGCHRLEGADPRILAPALDQLSSSLQRSWLVQWLRPVETESKSASEGLARRMPHFQLSTSEVDSLADYLLAPSGALRDPDAPFTADEATDPNQIEAGKSLFLTLGCLACHQWQELGNTSLFDGGDLTHIADKRPPRFFTRWLSDPATLNREHRMPIFDLDETEKRQLAAFLGEQSTHRTPAVVPRTRPADTNVERSTISADAIQSGRRLFQEYRCESCHVGPGHGGDRRRSAPLDRLAKLTRQSDWEKGCCSAITRGEQPRYQISGADRKALQGYVRQVVAPSAGERQALSGRQLLHQHNCFGCHDRELSQGISKLVPELVAAHAPLANVASDLVPPSLNTVGDKFHDSALMAAVKRSEPVRRRWLRVQMPRFRLSDAQFAAIVEHFRLVDRVPQRQTDTDKPSVSDMLLRIAGGRLLTTDGFGCVSCHAVGSVKPRHTAPGTRGPALDRLSHHVRRSWFDRLLRSPARIARRLEMPSVQTPVHGVLDDHLASQIDAIWHVLGLPSFDPPQPNPVRIIRHTGDPGSDQRASIVTDVVRTPQGTFIKPLLVGFGNRHSLAYDLASAGMLRWSVGDAAYQRIEGKTWYWEAAGEPLVQWEGGDPELSIVGDQAWRSVRRGQFATELDRWSHLPNGVQFDHRLHFQDDASATQTLRVRQVWTAWNEANQQGVYRKLTISGLVPGQAIRLRVGTAPKLERELAIEASNVLSISGSASTSIRLLQPAEAAIADDGSVTIKAPPADDDSVESPLKITLLYVSDFPVDRFPNVVVTSPVPNVVSLDVVPGFPMKRVPLGAEIMPTAFAWKADGSLFIASLQGRVWLASDTDGDRLEDQFNPFSDELAAPFGLATGPGYVDVLNKFALLRLYDDDQDGRVDRTEAVASGWAHTADYHDWAIGLPRDESGNYFVALPCQQDDRDPAAVKFRGRVLKLVPIVPTPLAPRRFRLVEWAAGNRFPIGLALSREGVLVATDNEGNYNPFNELNHIVRGHHYGFINRMEQRSELAHAVTPPAIEIPHPWTRSVNGICFLELNNGSSDESDKESAHFGPFTGQLIGCEYSTRRLIRMSLHEVNGLMQGAAYPFSLDPEEVEIAMAGPVCCGVSPTGQIYVGSIRESGWGGGNNFGELLRMEFDSARLPCGIREVRAVAGGFRIEFTRPVDRVLAEDRSRYNISSYYRVSTPAYGGEDQQRRRESVEDVRVAADAMAVGLRMESLAAGRVYEIRLQPLVADDRFFPAEAFYTLRAIPED